MMRSSWVQFVAAVGVATLLAGCTKDMYADLRDERGYSPELPWQIYPIDVASGAVKLKLPARSASLSVEEEDAVRRLAVRAKMLETKIVVQRPSRSLNAEVVAARVTRLLTEGGILPERIRHRTYKGNGPVIVTYRRKFAVTKPCGDWSRPVTETKDNRPYNNFGCAQQHNIAAMVDNPEDFERPQVMDPVDGANRAEAIAKYRENR